MTVREAASVDIDTTDDANTQIRTVRQTPSTSKNEVLFEALQGPVQTHGSLNMETLDAHIIISVMGNHFGEFQFNLDGDCNLRVEVDLESIKGYIMYYVPSGKLVRRGQIIKLHIQYCLKSEPNGYELYHKDIIDWKERPPNFFNGS